MPNHTNDYDVCTENFNRIYNDTFNEVKVYIASKCEGPSCIGDILQETYFGLYILLLYKLSIGMFSTAPESVGCDNLEALWNSRYNMMIDDL